MTDTKSTSELLDLVGSVEALAENETEKAREAYRGLLLRLAREQPKKGDTPAAINALLKDTGRSAPEFRADVDAVVALVELACEARGLTELRGADQKAAVALSAGQAEHERVVKEAEERVDALAQARNVTSRRLYSAADAQRALLQRLGLDRAYERKLDALATAEGRLGGTGGDVDAATDAQGEVERRRAEVWDLWGRALALSDHDPFRTAPTQNTVPPLRSEGSEWKQVDPS